MTKVSGIVLLYGEVFIWRLGIGLGKRGLPPGE